MIGGPAKEALRKENLINKILSFNNGSRLDFRREYLAGLSAGRLRHILLYARTMRMEKKRLPIANFQTSERPFHQILISSLKSSFVV